MGKVIFNITMSLDGFVAGPNDNRTKGLGDGGDALFNWYFTGNTEIPISNGNMTLKVSTKSAKILKDSINHSGAWIWGRRTFDIANAWNGNPPGLPCFIVTHHVPRKWNKKDSPFTFIPDGVERAIGKAKKAAGKLNVVICTANILQQALDKSLVDEIHLDIAPLLLGKGVRLFDHLGIDPVNLECLRAIKAPGVVHLGYRVKH
jgi:dihydrofolate reductase